MSELGFFIDIERFIKWTYSHEDLFGSDFSKDFGENTVKKWRRDEVLPSETSIKKANRSLREGEKAFDKINIAELMICINNAKDHNRGKNTELMSVTSTGKKIMTLLLLGRTVDDKKDNGFLTASINKDSDVHAYLLTVSERRSCVKTYYYLPGRTVSLEQLCNLSNDYKNGITPEGIYDGLQLLQQLELVECVDKKLDLYKLNFEGCKSFLCKNK